MGDGGFTEMLTGNRLVEEIRKEARRQQSEKEPEATLMQRELVGLHENVHELQSSLEWLLQKVRSEVCVVDRPPSVGQTGEAKDQEAVPGKLRLSIRKASEKVAELTAMIAPLKYTIEI